MSASRNTNRRRSTSLIAFLALALWLCSTIAQAESIAVIVNKNNPSEPLRQVAVADMYHGETLNWPNGERIKLVNREISAPVRKQFYERVLNAKSDEVFYRQGTPIPVQSVIERSDEAVVNFVATIEGAIGYVSLSNLKKIGSDQVKVILIVESP
ncbi:MAG: substrate-binding domain-containing protein [Nitrospirota bacterium]